MSLLQCQEHGYTLKPACPACGKTTTRAGPAKYSPEDTYGAYRRKLKILTLKERLKTSGAPE